MRDGGGRHGNCSLPSCAPSQSSSQAVIVAPTIQTHCTPPALSPPLRLTRARRAGGTAEGSRRWISTAGARWLAPGFPLQPQPTAVAFCGHCGLSELLLRRCGRRLRCLGAGGGLLSCRTGKSPSYVTHAPMVQLPVASARGPGDERKRGGDLRRVQAADPGTGGGKATPNTQQLSRGTKDPTLTTET